MQRVCNYKVDVLVCGGGVAGVAAGIAAARAGKRVLLLENSESLGGLCTNGYITGIAGLVDGICKQWLERLDADGDALFRPHLPVVEPEKGKLMLEKMLLQSGCRILYGVRVVDCTVEDGKISRVVAYSVSGRMEIQADIYIDTTGDAALAYSAGVPCEVGNAEFMGLNQSSSLGFRLSYVNVNKYQAAEMAYQEREKDNPDRSQLIRAMEFEAIKNGDLPFLVVPGLLVYPIPNANRECCDVTLDATQSYYCRNDDVEDKTRQIVDQHRQIEWFVAFLKKYIPGFENCALSSIAGMHGVRDSRRIVGEYTLTDVDVADGAKFDDAIAQHTEFFDAHHPTCGNYVAIRHIHVEKPLSTAICRPAPVADDGNMHPFFPMPPYEARTNPRDWSEIPYRCLVPKQIDNLLVAGRCVSAQFHAIGSIRVIATSMSMGEAAGTAAALCLDKSLSPRELDGCEVRRALIDSGVGLDHPPAGYWQMLREQEGEIVIGGNDCAVIKNPESELQQMCLA